MAKVVADKASFLAAMPGIAKMTVNACDNAGKGLSAIPGFPFEIGFDPVTDDEAKAFTEAAGPALAELLFKFVGDHPAATVAGAFALLLAGKVKIKRKVVPHADKQPGNNSPAQKPMPSDAGKTAGSAKA